MPVGSNAQRALQRYLFRHRPSTAHPGIENVFLSVHGTPLTENSIKLMFARLAKRSEVHRLHAHLCRHTFVTGFLTNGGDVFTLQQTLGRSSPAATMKYAHLNTGALKTQHDKVSPVRNLMRDKP